MQYETSISIYFVYIYLFLTIPIQSQVSNITRCQPDVGSAHSDRPLQISFLFPVKCEKSGSASLLANEQNAVFLWEAVSREKSVPFPKDL